MSETSGFHRRDFLKLVGLGVAGAGAGCARPPDHLTPYLVAPEDVLPGVSTWYASTCGECPGGCGVLVRAREGRVVKVEGNPEHPVNRGALCVRGQASLQGLYDPDRLKGPVERSGGSWRPVAWDPVIARVADRIRAAKSGGRRVVLLTGAASGSFLRLAREWAAAAGGSHLVYEAFAREPLRAANRATFGRDVVPAWDLERARYVISFGGDFLETLGSPVAQARGFAAMRSHPQWGWFVAVEPRLSATGANADEWVPARPGTEIAVALGMAHVILRDGLGTGPAAAVAEWTPERVEQVSEIPPDTLVRLAHAFANRRPSLAIAGGVAAQSAEATALAAAVNLLNHVAGNVGETVRFDAVPEEDATGSFADLRALAGSMAAGEVEVLIVHGADPVFSTPAWAGFAAAMEKVPLKVSLAPGLDDTSARCDLVLPAAHPLECFGDAHPVRGVWSLQQPAMVRVPLFDARPAGDTLIALARAAGAGSFPATWQDYLRAQWAPLHARFGGGGTFDDFWDEALRRGGAWEGAPSGPAGAEWKAEAPAFAVPRLEGAGDLALVLFPTHLHDGRGANKPWLQELPDPTTSAVWDTWVELHPETAARLGVATGDRVEVRTEAGTLVGPAYLYAGLRRDVVAVPLGRGHAEYGRYAKGRGANPLALLPRAEDAASGALAYLGAMARVRKAPPGPPLALAQPSKTQSDRGVGQGIPVASLIALQASGGVAGYILQPGRGEGTRTGSAHPAPAPPGATPEEQAHIPSGLGGQGPRGVNRKVLLETPPSQRKLGRFTEPRQPKPGEVIPPHAITAYEPIEKVRSPRQIPATRGSYSNPLHRHRWAMAIDVNACTGCQACVVGCYAENNVPTVGPAMVQRGRLMSWLRIERFEEAVSGGPNDVRFVPMLCQHCTDAPCEPVCPVYATYHNPEGLNAQIYNRCVGTRYCSNNCPYKVRQFNWFDYSAPAQSTYAFPEPLNWQLNPDVTVRSKGVMEKCTFCVQRILEAKGIARDEDRPLRDGEIRTACQQACPTGAIVFGDLLDPASAVSRLSADQRRYWVFNELNTKPAITYLKKIERESELA